MSPKSRRKTEQAISEAEWDACLESAFRSDGGGADESVVPGPFRAGILTAAESSEHAAPCDADSDADAGTDGSSFRYELGDEIARGGVGVVRRGHDLELGRDVAIKVLADRHRDNPELVLRFIEEARIAGRLQHPGVVPVYELGIDATRRPFFAMKLVQGRTLAHLLSERESPESDRGQHLGVFEAVCQTIAYAHSRGVVHRDLNPANVMVGAFGEVLVVDWGFAKILHPVDSHGARRAESEVGPAAIGRVDGGDEEPAGGAGELRSGAGSVFGTPEYMAPEQARGNAVMADERADVFALGAILCTMLTGRPPFSGESARDTIDAAANARLEDAFRRLSTCEADPELVGIARRCLEADRNRRPRHAGVVADAVLAYLATLAERAQQAQLDAAEARGRIASERKARRLANALALSLAVILVSIGVIWWIGHESQSRRLQVEHEARVAMQAGMRCVGAGAWSEALVALNRAEALLAAGHADVPMGTEVAALQLECAQRAFDGSAEVEPGEADSRVSAAGRLPFGGEARRVAESLRGELQKRRPKARKLARLGEALFCTGDFETAIAVCRQAVEIDAYEARGHEFLSLSLMQTGHYSGALASYEDALRVGDPAPHTRLQLESCRRMAGLEKPLRALLKFGSKPTAPEARILFARMCVHKGFRLTAAHAFSEVLNGEHDLGRRDTALLFHEAICAAIGAAHDGPRDEVRRTSASARADLLRTGLEHLRNCLRFLTERLESRPWRASLMEVCLERLQQDVRLDPVREKRSLAALPTSDRQAWQQAWTRIETLLRGNGR